MNKLIAWVSIIIITMIAIFYLMNRPTKQSHILTTYTEPHAYSISYPSAWLREEQGEKSGHEILALYSYDYRNPEVAGDVFGPGQIKITVSILPKDSQSLEQIAALQSNEFQKDYRKELLSIDGHQAILISPSAKLTAGPSSQITLYIDYTEAQYALVVGYYDGNENSAAIIRKVLESFKISK